MLGALYCRLPHRCIFLALVFVVAACLLALAGPTHGHAAAPIVVTWAHDLDTTQGCPATQDTPCSLRNAINAANSNPGPDTILFDPAVFGSDGSIYARSNYPFVDATQGITIDGGTSHIVIKVEESYPQLGWGLVFVSPTGMTAQNVTAKNIGAESTVYDAIQVCPAPNTNNGDCEAPASNITMTNVSGYFSGYSGIRILGSNISGVSLTGASESYSGTAGIIVQASGGTISDVTVDQGHTAHNHVVGLQIASHDTGDSTVKGDINGVTINGFTTTKDGDTGVLIEGRAIDGVNVDGLNSVSATTALAVNQNQSASNVSITHSNISLGSIGICSSRVAPKARSMAPRFRTTT